jgi:hypothetical protein
VKTALFYRVRVAFCQMCEDLQEGVSINWDFDKSKFYFIFRPRIKKWVEKKMIVTVFVTAGIFDSNRTGAAAVGVAG